MSMVFDLPYNRGYILCILTIPPTPPSIHSYTPFLTNSVSLLPKKMLCKAF